ncbi:MAG TPA: hypothetical protein VGF94_24885 [Kofleriaceae bacterium]|jgi:hypothetical protein
MTRFLTIASLLLAACDPADLPPPAAPTAKVVQPTDHQLCVQLFAKSRTCSAQFVPALVDARASADQPHGIADAVKADRAGVIAQANQEWADDSQDAAIDTRCTALPSLGSDRDAAEHCLSAADCDGFVSCEMPILAAHLGDR